MILGIDGRLANAARPAGAGHYCREVLRALDGLDPGVEIRVYLDGPPRDNFPAGTGEIRVLPPRRLWTHRALAAELRGDPPHVFFSPVTQVPWRCPCPALVSVLDLGVWHHPGHYPRHKWVGMAIKTAHALRRGDHFIAISESTARDLERCGAIARDRITVAPLGVSQAYLDAGARGGHGLPRPGGLPDRYVLYVGQLQPRKNLIRLVDAFGQIIAAHPALPQHLVIAGPDGWGSEAIHRAIDASPAAHRIHRLGYVADREMPGLLAGADLLAIVSLWEGFGLPALEAMAAGTAVLASNCGALPEVVGRGGLLVDPNDTDNIAAGLALMLLDDTMRGDCANAGRARAQDFTWSNTAQAIVRAAASAPRKPRRS